MHNGKPAVTQISRYLDIAGSYANATLHCQASHFAFDRFDRPAHGRITDTKPVINFNQGKVPA
jgi:hypothetical protein